MTQRDETIKVRLVDQQSWIQGHTNDEIKAAQRNDTALQIIIKWLEYQDKPDNELFLMSKAAKAYWINEELVILDQDGLLWKQDEGTKVLVLPSTMNLCHDVPAAGHQGVSRTLSRVKERFYWYTLSTDVQNYVASCAVCNRNKKKNNKTSSLQHDPIPCRGTNGKSPYGFSTAITNYQK